MPRIAVLDFTRCKPKKCSKECMRFCPGIRTGKQVITLDEKTGKPLISEELCSGEKACGICIKKCPFKAIYIVNIPEELDKDRAHAYGRNGFRLYRLPIPKPGKVVGLVGQNGTGKSTALKILAGEIKPNLGDYENSPSWEDIVKNYRGLELQAYFQRLAAEEQKVVYKPQYVDKIPKQVQGTVDDLLDKVDDKGGKGEVARELGIDHILKRDIGVLSGGELQKFAIAALILKEADVYLFDEPTSFLDISERLRVARAIRRLAEEEGRIVVVVEHDLATLDYLSDYVSIFYGDAGVYGIVSHPHGVREGINIFLSGYISDENMRFRSESITFDFAPAPVQYQPGVEPVLEYGVLERRFGRFKLNVEKGSLYAGEIVGIIGPNGIGKTTFARILTGELEPENGESPAKDLKISHKPQYITPTFEGSVYSYISMASKNVLSQSWFKSDVIKPLNIEPLLEMDVEDLSGGELQKVEVAACLAREADLYIFDESSAYISSEDRLTVARTIKRLIQNRQVAAFCIEHDIVMCDYLSDRLIVFDGKPGIEGQTHSPTDLRTGMNSFLKTMDITFRRDPTNGRPRVNKSGSRLDREQKDIGEYYYMPIIEET
ncbi:MAG: ribosome biogenesis/translation initiation ATPase RLI [Candidatus Wukongarchaeota archaeon]|nr:ribosome biogenesis/translation initiation ATPase RLI [Candidatus Wukongarchaeota archaeon]